MTISTKASPGGPDGDDIPMVAAVVASESPPVALPTSSTYTAPTASMVNVVAPCALSEGYSFSAQVDGIDFEVVVPKGGVQEGQTFQVPYPNRNSAPSSSSTSPQVIAPMSATTMAQAPTGRWRNNFCSCFDVCCDALFWMGWCLTPIVLGQLAQRMRLNICGAPGGNRSTCQSVAAIVAIYYGLLCLGLGVFLWPFSLVYFVVLGLNVRYQYRKHYQIPTSMACFEGCCDGQLEDLCCAFWCECCMTIQIARHSHDEKMYHYQACTETGLSETAPPIIV